LIEVRKVNKSMPEKHTDYMIPEIT
jgi:hypothetical protein